MKIALIVLGLSLVNIFLFVSATEKFVEGTTILLLCCCCSTCFLLLTVRGIYMDEKLVKVLTG